MKQSLIALLFLGIIAGCKTKEQVPPDVLSVNKMKALVWEMEIADQKASDLFLQQKDSLRMESTSLYQQVFAKHKTNKANFYKSLAFYESRPDLMKTLMDSVTEYGNRQKTGAYKKAY